MAERVPVAALRIDKVLWFLRLTKTRPLAQELAETGHIRLNGRRIDRASAKIATGDVLTLPLGNAVQVIEIVSLPLRRGPALEARSCYRVLDGLRSNPIAAANQNVA
ncbi:RNA-binding S4 domain-containing protein [Novosphingobium aquimarinum]|uniref:RNA-binding S4 domain-containing protein n=1 Tax=Novosphingobium aquimarinum TaxID=2682494 RepID=UPI0012EBF0DB|nr:S4 domain-containing protein [Novosphingobium aquimarinum]